MKQGEPELHGKSPLSAFGPFRLDGGRLSLEGVDLHLSPKEQGVLDALVEASGAVVPADRLMDRVWGDGEVGSGSLARCISTLRRRLAGKAEGPVIETHHRRGYSLAIPLRHFDRDAAGILTPLDGTPYRTAYGFLLQAHQLVGRRSAAEIDVALDRLDRAVAVDPNFLPALSAIADLQVTRAVRRYLPPRAAGERAISAAEDALARFPRASGPLGVTGFVRTVIEGDKDGLADLDQAVVRDPESWILRFYRGWALCGLGQGDKAAADIEAGLRLSPMNPGFVGAAGYLMFCCGRAERGLEILREGVAELPLTDTVHAAYSAILSWKASHRAAVEHGGHAARIAGDNASFATLHIYALAHSGRMDEASQRLDALLSAQGLGPAPSLLAAVHVAMGNDDLARASLTLAEREGCPYRHVIRFDPRLAEFLDRERATPKRPHHVQ